MPVTADDNVWERTSRSQMSGPNVKVEYRTENAFRAVNRQTWCRDSYPRLRISGHSASRVSRVNELHSLCYADSRCQPIGYFVKPWATGWR